MPPSSGSSTKYAIVGVVLLAIVAVGLYFKLDCGGSAPVITPDAGAGLRSTALAEPELYIPDPEPDAGPEIDAGPPQKIVKIRYIRDPWDCSGDISNARRVLAGYRPQFRNCYERALKTNHTLAGTLRLHLLVGAAGEVKDTKVRGTLRSAPEVVSCVSRLARTVRFTAPQGGRCAVISAPFRFSPME